MFFHIHQRTRYRYAEPVALAPQAVRLRPRSNGVQRLQGFAQEVTPAPRLVTEGIDLEGSAVTGLWFAGEHRQLEVVTTSRVETLRPDPYDYELVHPTVSELPIDYPSVDRRVLRAYRDDDAPHEAVRELSARLRDEAGGRSVPFVKRLCAWIHLELSHHVRWGDPAPRPPEETLRRGGGACRDLAELFVAACRSAGIAARFASGYTSADPQNKRFMHAWAEVYFPGPGWRGFDPTEGGAVDDRYVAVAAGLAHENAAPVIAALRTEGASYELDYDVAVRASATEDALREMVGDRLPWPEGF